MAKKNVYMCKYCGNEIDIEKFKKQKNSDCPHCKKKNTCVIKVDDHNRKFFKAK